MVIINTSTDLFKIKSFLNYKLYSSSKIISWKSGQIPAQKIYQYLDEAHNSNFMFQLTFQLKNDNWNDKVLFMTILLEAVITSAQEGMMIITKSS